MQSFVCSYMAYSKHNEKVRTFDETVMNHEFSAIQNPMQYIKSWFGIYAPNWSCASIAHSITCCDLGLEKDGATP